MLRIYNTLSRKVEDFVAIKPLTVGIYSCGPTVYDYAHIGHMRKYTMDDILVRVLRANGYKVTHVMNITDVGHLVSDEDTGEDKMEKGARKYGLSVWDIAKRFEDQFFASTTAVGITRPDEVMHATDYIKEQIALIKTLEEKRYTYEIPADGIYFDTSKFPDYFKLSRQNPEELKKGARVEFVEGKRNVSDFALWKFSKSTPDVKVRSNTSEVAQRDSSDGEGKLGKRQMEWDSPWGVGFPGWHIECSAMSLKALTNFFSSLSEVEGKNPEVTSYSISEVAQRESSDGEGKYTIDIHTGGIDHIPVHHSNEIAQSEAATGEKFVNYWVHHNFLVVNGDKMSKSLGNFYTVQDLISGKGLPAGRQGYDPRALRYLYLQTHYRQEMNFTWESLDAAQTALTKLRLYCHSGEPKATLESDSGQTSATFSSSARMTLAPNLTWMKKFMDALNDDLNTAKALSVVWEMVKDENLLPGEKKGTLLEMDKILGLGLDLQPTTFDLRLNDLPQEVQNFIAERESFRKAGDWAAADEIRSKIEELGYTLKDTKEGPKVVKG